MAFWNILNQCDGYIQCIDKYFSLIGLQFLYNSINRANVKDIKILVANEKANENLRHSFEKFRNELKEDGIDCQLHVLVERDAKKEIHDRYVITRDLTFNVPSVDTAEIEIGQFNEIKKSTIVLPFSRWWSNSLDILTQWNEIKKGQGPVK